MVEIHPDDGDPNVTKHHVPSVFPLGTYRGPAPGADLHGRGDGRDGAREASEAERQRCPTGNAGTIVNNSDG